MITGALPAVSNRETLNLQIEIFDDDAGELIDLSTATEITIAIAPRGTSRAPILTATLTGGGVTNAQTGTLDCVFSVDQMRTLCAGTYDIGGTLVKDGETSQFMIGALPILDGIVS